MGTVDAVLVEAEPGLALVCEPVGDDEEDDEDPQPTNASATMSTTGGAN
jgi:hypothetical protein